jgi:hypothetical protein
MSMVASYADVGTVGFIGAGRARLRIPIRRGRSAGATTAQVTGLAGTDDFAFTRHGDRRLIALDAANQVVLVAPHGTPSTVLTAQDGLSNPTSVTVRGDTIYVPSAAYLTRKDPNLLLAHLRRH